MKDDCPRITNVFVVPRDAVVWYVGVVNPMFSDNVTVDVVPETVVCVTV